MATKVIDNNEARVPFFGDKISFVTGLDPLGLQNPSTQAYSYLLPGLNNVTTRIRNYSFYCWLLQEYAINIESTNPNLQKKFIRRAEYIIALLSVHAGIEGISGSNYANNRFKENIKEFDLEGGTYNPDGSTINTYWQYGFGVFGQYYVGSLRQVGLIEDPIDSNNRFLGLYRRTSQKEGVKIVGEDLALAFEANIDQKNKLMFMKCINEGRIDTGELKALANDFNLTQIPINNIEHQLLLELLLDVDEPLVVTKTAVSMRRETIIHILKFINNEENTFEQRSFTSYAYNLKGRYNHGLDNCLTGWYYYQFNEYYQVASTAILNGCLDYLQQANGPGWMPLNQLINICKNDVIQFLNQNNYITSPKNTIAEIILANIDLENDLYENIINNVIVKRMAYSFLLLWQLYKRNKDNLQDLRVFTNERNIGDNEDVVTFYLKFEKYLQKNIEDFILDFLANNVIYRHQYVAYRKMGGGSQSTQKFIIEGNYIRQIGNFGPGYTSPRINSLISFLYDLNLLNDSKKLTNAGDQLLEYNK